MTDDTNPTRQAIAAVNRSAPGKVTGRLHAAIMEMTWKGASRAEAAKAAGMTDHSLRTAFRKAHVKAFYLQELGILRTSERARTHHRLVELRDQDSNVNAAVSAAKLLESLEAESSARPISSSAAPGVTIIIHDREAAPPMRTIDAYPADEDEPEGE
jgi:hypothetical protein